MTGGCSPALPGPLELRRHLYTLTGEQQAGATAFLPLLICLHPKPKQHIRNPATSTENQALSQKPKAVLQSLGTTEPTTESRSIPPAQEHGPQPEALA